MNRTQPVARVRCIGCGQPVALIFCELTDPGRRYAVAMHPSCARRNALASPDRRGAGEEVASSLIPNPYLFPGAPR